MGSQIISLPVYCKIQTETSNVTDYLSWSNSLHYKDSHHSAKEYVHLNAQLLLPPLYQIKKKYGPFLWMGFDCLKAWATLRRQFTFLPLSSQKDLILILSTSEGWKAESTFEPPNVTVMEHTKNDPSLQLLKKAIETGTFTNIIEQTF